MEQYRLERTEVRIPISWPLKRIKTSKSMHGWLNTGQQKSKISPDATELHKCPRCQEPDETQEHILKCQHVSAHQKRYDLVHPDDEEDKTKQPMSQSKKCLQSVSGPGSNLRKQLYRT